MDANLVYFVGTAGAGKSTLVAAFDEWCQEHGLNTLIVNLDPGAEELPYEAAVDVRENIRLVDVMQDYGLGPNGAQVAAADLIALQLEDLRKQVMDANADLVLIDTPGQLELFVFREAGRYILQGMDPQKSVVAYLMDPLLARSASGFASQLLLGATTHFRLQAPMAYVLSKSDTLTEQDVDTISTWAADSFALEDAVMGEDPTMGRELAAQVSRLIDGMELHQRLVPASSIDRNGLDEIYHIVQSTIGGSEDSTPEYDTFLAPDQDDINLG